MSPALPVLPRTTSLTHARMHACTHVCPGLTATRDWRPGKEMDCRDMGYGFGDLLKVDEYICPARRQPSAWMSATELARVRARASATALTDRQILSLSLSLSHTHTHAHTVDAVRQQMTPIRNEEQVRDDDACRRPPPPLLGLSQTHNILVNFSHLLWHSNCSPAQALRNRPLYPQQTIASP